MLVRRDPLPGCLAGECRKAGDQCKQQSMCRLGLPGTRRERVLWSSTTEQRSGGGTSWPGACLALGEVQSQNVPTETPSASLPAGINFMHLYLGPAGRRIAHPPLVVDWQRLVSGDQSVRL